MTALQAVNTWTVHPISALPRSPRRPQTGLRAAMRSLGLEEALFFAANGRTLKTQAASLGNEFGLLRREFPDRRYRTRQDKEQDGIWVWWEPRP